VTKATNSEEKHFKC